MTDTEFETWVAHHCEATGADIKPATTLLANRGVFVADWRATAAELAECTRRLVAHRKVPRWANEHTDAVGRELKQLREERAGDDKPDHSAAYYEAPKCALCGGSGLVAVPLPKCVSQGRLMVHPGGYAGVLTGAVLCDERGCAAGQAARDREGRVERPRPSLRAYLTHFGGHDLVALLRLAEREKAARARRGAPANDGWSALLARIAARVQRPAPPADPDEDVL